MNEQTEPGDPLPQPSPDAIPQRDQSPLANNTDNKDVPSVPERHSRKCQICRHPDREEIEQDYRDWFTAATIARRYNVDDSALHRHLRAAGLVSRRSENLRTVLDRILERGAEGPISGNTIVRAVKAYTCLTDDNKWVEPQRTVIHIQSKEVPGATQQ